MVTWFQVGSSVSDTLGRVKKNYASTGKAEPLPLIFLSLSRINVTSFEGGFSFPAIAPPGCQCGWQANQLVQQLCHLRHRVELTSPGEPQRFCLGTWVCSGQSNRQALGVLSVEQGKGTRCRVKSDTPASAGLAEISALMWL